MPARGNLASAIVVCKSVSWIIHLNNFTNLRGSSEAGTAAIEQGRLSPQRSPAGFNSMQPRLGQASRRGSSLRGSFCGALVLAIRLERVYGFNIDDFDTTSMNHWRHRAPIVFARADNLDDTRENDMNAAHSQRRLAPEKSRRCFTNPAFRGYDQKPVRETRL
jgi:hypothetical protein